jgi:hypothetical protein
MATNTLTSLGVRWVCIVLCVLRAACAVVALLERTGFPDVLGREWIFVRMHDAVQTCLAAMISSGQAVRPLSAYDSQAISPKAGAPAGPGPLLFHPPGRHSPTHLPRRSLPNVPGPDALQQQQQQPFSGARRQRLSWDGSNSGGGNSPLLPQKFGSVQAGGLSPRFAAGALGSAFDSPRIGTGPAAASAGLLVGGKGSVCSMDGSSSSSRARADSTPGFTNGGGQHALSGLQGDGGAQPQAGQEGRQDAWNQQQQWEQDSSHLQHQQGAQQDLSGVWASGAAGQVLNHSSNLWEAAAARGSGGKVSAPMVVSPHLPPPVHVSARGHSADASWPVAPGSASSVAPLPPPVSLGGLQLHIHPTVLHHPAVLSRAHSSAGDGYVSGPLSTSSSFRRPVSPRTERLLDEVFSASNGDEYLAADATAGSQSLYQGAALQLTEICSDASYDVRVGLGVGHEQQSLPQHEQLGSVSAGAAHAGEVRLLLGHPQGNRVHQG